MPFSVRSGLRGVCLVLLVNIGLTGAMQLIICILCVLKCQRAVISKLQGRGVSPDAENWLAGFRLAPFGYDYEVRLQIKWLIATSSYPV